MEATHAFWRALHNRSLLHAKLASLFIRCGRIQVLMALLATRSQVFHPSDLILGDFLGRYSSAPSMRKSLIGRRDSGMALQYGRMTFREVMGKAGRESMEQTEITEQTEGVRLFILFVPCVPLFPFVPYSLFLLIQSF